MLFVASPTTSSPRAPTRPEQQRSLRGASSQAEEGLELFGPFAARIVADITLGSGSSTYLLKVKGCNGEHIVQRKYSCFAELSVALGQHCRLPGMPPKSVFRRRFSFRFREERAVALGDLVSAAVANDPLAKGPALRRFLGLSHIEAGESKDGPCPMDMIAETVRETRAAEKENRTVPFENFEVTSGLRVSGLDWQVSGVPLVLEPDDPNLKSAVKPSRKVIHKFVSGSGVRVALKIATAALPELFEEKSDWRISGLDWQLSGVPLVC